MQLAFNNHLGQEVAFGLDLDQDHLEAYRSQGLRLADFMTAAPFPASYDASIGVAGMTRRYKNAGAGAVGDCVQAGEYHRLNCWTRNAGEEFQPTDEQVIADYSAITGYVPGRPETDRGSGFGATFYYYARHGYADGSKLLGWWIINPNDPDEVRRAIWLFQGLLLGFACPNEWVTAARPGGVWDSAPPNYRQGHCIFAYGFTPRDAAVPGVYISTWGMHRITLTDQACTTNLSPNVYGQMYAGISEAMILRGMQRCPNGLDWDRVVAELQLRIGGPLPTCPPPAGLRLTLEAPEVYAGVPFRMRAEVIDGDGRALKSYAGYAGMTAESGIIYPSGITTFMANGSCVLAATARKEGLLTLRVNVPWFGPQARVTASATVYVKPTPSFVAHRSGRYRVRTLQE